MSSPTPTTTTTSEATEVASTTSAATTTASETTSSVATAAASETTATAATTTKTEKTTTAVVTTSIPIGQVGQLNFAVFKRAPVLPPSPTRSAHPGRSPTKFQYDHLICTKPISSSFVKPSFFTFESTQPTPISSDHLYTLSRFGGFTQPANTSALGSTTGNPPISPNLRSPKSPVFVAPKSPGFLGQQNSAISSIFGAMPMAAVGVSGTGNWGTGFVRYQPSMGTDVFMKNEQVTSINTKQYCITTMKVYEGKSLEELRMEDYLSNNKGPRAGAVDLLCPKTPPAKNLLGAPAQAQQVNGNFGQQPIPFGNTNVMPGFGQQRAFGATAGQSSAGGVINKPPAPTMTTSSFGFGNTANTPPTNLFVPPKPFGPPPVTGNVFGAGQTAQPGFGNPVAPPAFGQPNIGFDQANVPPGPPFFGPSPIVPVFGHTIAVFGNPVLGQMIPT
uniref:Nuclear pore complex protein Nup98-Nup96 n=1 Tax=Lutzomyia longipalpis TaxID=7200 RepID=A0A1B0CEY8_LUTLO